MRENLNKQTQNPQATINPRKTRYPNAKLIAKIVAHITTVYLVSVLSRIVIFWTRISEINTTSELIQLCSYSVLMIIAVRPAIDNMRKFYNCFLYLSDQLSPNCFTVTEEDGKPRSVIMIPQEQQLDFIDSANIILGIILGVGSMATSVVGERISLICGVMMLINALLFAAILFTGIYLERVAERKGYLPVSSFPSDCHSVSFCIPTPGSVSDHDA